MLKKCRTKLIEPEKTIKKHLGQQKNKHPVYNDSVCRIENCI